MPFALPDGLQDVTPSMNVGNFIPGFTLSATAEFVSNDDPLGIWFYSTGDQQTNLKDATLTVAADSVNLSSFDLTAISLPEYPTSDGIDGSYLFTITGYKLDGSTVVTTMHNQQKSLELDLLPDFSAFTGITKFDVRIQAELYAGQWLFAVSNLTFDSFAIANAVSGNIAPAFANPSALALTAPQNGNTTFEGQLGVIDGDPGQTLTWSQGTAPAHGTISFSGATASSGSGTITPGGTITYTPAAGYAGTDTFTVQVSDGHATATRVVQVNVTPATPSAPDLASASDTGTSNSDNLTNASSLTFTGLGAVGDSTSTVTVFIDQDGSGTKNTGDVIGSATMSNGTWTVSGLSTAGLADGSYNVYAITSAGGITGATSSALGIRVDKTAPTLAISSSKAALKAGETATITFTFSEDPGSTFDWNGTSGDVVVTGGTLSALSGTGTVRTAVFTPNANTNGGTASITVAGGAYTDAAGNNGGASAAPSIVFDTKAPTLSITSDVSSLKIGETATITFTFSEDPAGSFAWDGASGDVLVSGGTLSAISGTGNVRTAVFTPVADTDGGTASITVAFGAYADAAGNDGNAGAAPSLTFDTHAPEAPSAPSLAAGSDTGLSDSDHLTNLTTPTLSGTAEAGATVKLYDGATEIGSGTADGSGNWSITTSALGEGAHTVRAVARDAAGNVGVASGVIAFTVDTSAPTLAITSNKSALTIGQTATVTFTFSEDPGASFDASDVIVSGGTLGAISGTGNVRTAVFTPAIDTNAGTASISVAPGTYTDAAGNNGGAGATPGITFDTLAPTLTILSDVPSLKIGETATITFTFSEDPGASFTLAGIVVTGGILSDLSTTGSVRTATFTPAAGVNNGTATIAVAGDAYTDAAGNGGSAQATASLAYDTLAPVAPAGLALAATSDTGSSASDNLTNDITPTFTGTAEDGATVTLYGSGGVTVIGSGVATGGVWRITTSVLPDGAHSITAVATDAAGNTGAASASLQVTIDATPPAAPSAPDLADSSDTGDSTTDDITSDYTPTLNGTAESGTTVILYDSDGMTVLGTATATGGLWSITSSALASGVHNLTAVAIDAAGNASAPSAALAVTIDPPLIVHGGARGDVLAGSAGDEILDGGRGRDTMIGGDGNDTYFVDNRGDRIVEAPGEGVDQVYAYTNIALAPNVENVTLLGRASNATGNELDNVIVGNASNNVLTGGLGADTLTGGAGRDRFVFLSVGDSGVSAGQWDVITDFSSAEHDRIDLRAIDANPLVRGNQAFTFIGSAAFSSTDATGQLRFDAATHMLYGSTDANSDAEFAIELIGVTVLSARDLIL